MAKKKKTIPELEAAKEALRIMLIAIVPVLIGGVEAGSVDLKVVASIALLALLRSLDKYLHEFGKAEGSELLSKGLTRF